MRTMIAGMLEALRQRVADNLVELQGNEAVIRRMLAEPSTPQRAEELTRHFGISRRILEENRDCIRIQTHLMGFLNQHRASVEYNPTLAYPDGPQAQPPQAEPLDEGPQHELADPTNAERAEPDSLVLAPPTFQSLLEQTIGGQLPYGTSHPMYGNQRFINRLLKHYADREQYEECARLLAL